MSLISDPQATPASLLAGVEELPARHPVHALAAGNYHDLTEFGAQMREVRKTMAMRVLKETIEKRAGTYLQLISHDGLIKPEHGIIDGSKFNFVRNTLVDPSGVEIPPPQRPKNPSKALIEEIDARKAKPPQFPPKPFIMNLSPGDVALYGTADESSRPGKPFDGLHSFKPESLHAGEPIDVAKPHFIEDSVAAMPNHTILFYNMMPEYVSLHEHLRSFFLKRAKDEKIGDDVEAIIEATISVIHKIDEKQITTSNTVFRPKDVASLLVERAMDEAYTDFLDHLAKKRDERGGIDFNDQLITDRLHDSFEELVELINKRLDLDKANAKDNGPDLAG